MPPSFSHKDFLKALLPPAAHNVFLFPSSPLLCTRNPLLILPTPLPLFTIFPFSLLSSRKPVAKTLSFSKFLTRCFKKSGLGSTSLFRSIIISPDAFLAPLFTVEENPRFVSFWKSFISKSLFFDINSPMKPTELSTRSEEHTSELQSQFHLVCL